LPGQEKTSNFYSITRDSICRDKKKLATSILSLGIVFAGTSNVFAAETNSKEPTINWDNVWESVDSGTQLPSTTNFGSQSPVDGEISLMAWGDLASGSTALSLDSGKVKSTGKTKGKVLTTVTSATTSLRLSGMGYITGPKETAIAKFTATSVVSTNNPSGTQTFEGLTIHTATDSGVLYEARTYDSKSY
jgi:hypothetical protein